MQKSQAQNQRQPLAHLPTFAVFYLSINIYTVISSFRPNTKYSAHTKNSISVGDFALKQLTKTLAKLHFRLYASEKSTLWSFPCSVRLSVPVKIPSALTAIDPGPDVAQSTISDKLSTWCNHLVEYHCLH